MLVTHTHIHIFTHTQSHTHTHTHKHTNTHSHTQSHTCSHTHANDSKQVYPSLFALYFMIWYCCRHSPQHLTHLLISNNGKQLFPLVHTNFLRDCYFNCCTSQCMIQPGRPEKTIIPPANNSSKERRLHVLYFLKRPLAPHCPLPLKCRSLVQPGSVTWR